MTSPATFSVIAALALTGTGAGIYLGKAAVAEINPAYYSAPEPRFHGDLTPYRPSQAAGYRAGQLSSANLEQAFGSGCVGCRTYPEDVVLVHRASSGKVEAAYGELTSEPVQAVAYEVETSPEFAAVERYARYPVTAQAETVEEPAAEVELASAESVSPEAGE